MQDLPGRERAPLRKSVMQVGPGILAAVGSVCLMLALVAAWCLAGVRSSRLAKRCVPILETGRGLHALHGPLSRAKPLNGQRRGFEPVTLRGGERVLAHGIDKAGRDGGAKPLACAKRCWNVKFGSGGWRHEQAGNRHPDRPERVLVRELTRRGPRTAARAGQAWLVARGEAAAGRDG